MLQLKKYSSVLVMSLILPVISPSIALSQTTNLLGSCDRNCESVGNIILAQSPLSPSQLRAIDYGKQAAEFVKQDKYEDAIRMFDQSISADPNYTLSYLGRGLSRVATGDLKGGKADLQTALRLAKAQGNQEQAEMARKALALLDGV